MKIVYETRIITLDFLTKVETLIKKQKKEYTVKDLKKLELAVEKVEKYFKNLNKF